MKKKIQLILIKEYSNIGKKNTIFKVNKGYAWNYLIPNQIAEIATKNKIKHIEMFNKIANIKLQNNKIKAKNIETNLQLIKKINILKKIGDENYIFGNVNEKEVIEKIFILTGITINKKQIKIPNIKKIGQFNIEINLLYDKPFNIKLNIIPINI